MEFIKKLFSLGQINDKEVRGILKDIDKNGDRIGAICKQADNLKPKLQAYSAVIDIMGNETKRKDDLIDNLNKLTKLYEELENAKYWTKYRRDLKKRAKSLERKVKNLSDFGERVSLNPFLKVNHGRLRIFSKNYYEKMLNKLKTDQEDLQKKRKNLEKECAKNDKERMQAKRANDIKMTNARFGAKNNVLER